MQAAAYLDELDAEVAEEREQHGKNPCETRGVSHEKQI